MNNKYNCTPIPIYVYILRTCLHNPYLEIYELINIYKVVPVFSCTPPAPKICHITPFCEQPEQLNRDSIYICVYTHSLFIPFRRFYIFKIIKSCSLVQLFTPRYPGSRRYPLPVTAMTTSQDSPIYTYVICRSCIITRVKNKS